MTAKQLYLPLAFRDFSVTIEAGHNPADSLNELAQAGAALADLLFSDVPKFTSEAVITGFLYRCVTSHGREAVADDLNLLRMAMLDQLADIARDEDLIFLINIMKGGE